MAATGVGDWARWQASDHHAADGIPVNAVKSTRPYLGPADRAGQTDPFATAVFEAISDDQDISKEKCSQDCERDRSCFRDRQRRSRISSGHTDEAIARGAFGSPTIYLDKTDMYFGNDRLPLIHAKLLEKKAMA